MAAYPKNVIVFDGDPTAHVKTMRTLIESLRKHNLKVSPSKAVVPLLFSSCRPPPLSTGPWSG